MAAEVSELKKLLLSEDEAANKATTNATAATTATTNASNQVRQHTTGGAVAHKKTHRHASGSGSTLTAMDTLKSPCGTRATPAAVVERTTNNDTATQRDSLYFFEDEIFRIDKRGRVKFGLVVETSECYSGDEVDEFDDVLGKGEVRVSWYPEGKEEVQTELTIGLADRTLMPGDVVRRLLPGKDTQRGYCRDVKVTADVKVLGTKYVMKNVAGDRLRLIASWQRDSAVCLDSWVGSTKDSEEKAVLRSSTGSRIEVPSSDFFAFKESNTLSARGIFNPYVFYPGNTVVGHLQSLDNIKLLTPKHPLPTNKKGKPLTGKFTIESVHTESVWVHWQYKTLSDDAIPSSELQQPNPCVTGEDLKRLKRLNLFEPCMLQINDRNYLRYNSEDVIVRKTHWDHEQAENFKAILAAQQAEEKLQNGTANSAGHQQQPHHPHHHHHHSPHPFDKLRKKFGLGDSGSMEKSSGKLASGKKSLSTFKEKLSKERMAANAVKTEADWLSDEHDTENHDDDDDEDDRDGAAADADGRKDLKVELMDTDGPSRSRCEPRSSQSESSLRCSSRESVVTTRSSTCSSPSPHGSPRHLTRRQLKKKATAAKSLRKALINATTSSATISPLLGRGSPCGSDFEPSENDELVTEALLVRSQVTVVWQDGTVEENIPSTKLYPIHHLDNHEFFPGDFVISGKEETNVSYRDYGVIQTVDHHGRTARVKWFTTYTSLDEPKPTYNGESEVSVYDLKDHPDFQYRPGTMVIRVANFVGADANCTAGQIIDNFIDGRVKVWWVDGHLSMCWPQDLFEVGQYDHADWGHDSEDDSWETESENSELGGADGSSPKLSIAESHILSNIERARVAIARLEEIFNVSPNLQSADVMRKLMRVYKGCRCLDRLLTTSFFHEDHFDGLIERVWKGGSQTVNERAQVRKNRLFSVTPQSPSAATVTAQPSAVAAAPAASPIVAKCGSAVAFVSPLDGRATAPSKEYAPRVLLNMSSTPFKFTPTSCVVGVSAGGLSLATAMTGGGAGGAGGLTLVGNKRKAVEENTKDKTAKSSSAGSSSSSNTSLQTELLNITATAAATPPHNREGEERNELLSSAVMNIEKAFERTSQLKNALAAAANGNANVTPAGVPPATGANATTTVGGTAITHSSQDDSGNYSRNENCDGSSTSYASSSDLTSNVEANSSLTRVHDDQKSVSCSSIELNEDAAGSPELVSARLCALLKEQLVKCIVEIRERYYKEDPLNLSDVYEYDVSGAVAGVANNGNIVEDNDDDEDHDDGEVSVITDLTATSAAENAQPKVPAGVELEGEKQQTSERGITFVEEAASGESMLTSAGPSLDATAAADVCFQVLSTAPRTHKFHLTIFHPNQPQQYYKAVQREHRMLKNALPPGVWVRVFEDRMDLLSVMIEGPQKTPYANGMFFFDIQLGREYPKSPPLCHYISYCTDRLNPNLYEDGKVCVSLLGTWSGRDSEVWGPNSTLLQVIVSLQGLILVPEPYFNEAGYERQRGTQQGMENSRMYNEMVIIKLVQSTTKLLVNPPEIFHNEIVEHFRENGAAMHARIKGWMELSIRGLTADGGAEPAVVKKETTSEDLSAETDAAGCSQESAMHLLPDFPLVPASRGFCLTLAGLLDTFHARLGTLQAMAVPPPIAEDETQQNIQS